MRLALTSSGDRERAREHPKKKKKGNRKPRKPVSEMDGFFNATDEDRLEQVRRNANNVAGYSERMVDATWTQIHYLKRTEQLKLMEWWMRTETVQDRLDHWGAAQQESLARGDRWYARNCEYRMMEAAVDMALCDDKREEHRLKIQELERLQDRVEEHMRRER